ncbi:hypothetical protein O4H52_01645 [Sphingomonadaceae bacterium G21617-S1]|nr:hypothetical protein [Sphingomonadaceae bacterium G21617-S1]
MNGLSASDPSHRDGLSIAVEPWGDGELSRRREALQRLSRLVDKMPLEQVAALLATRRNNFLGTERAAVIAPVADPVSSPATLNPHGELIETAARAAGLRTARVASETLRASHIGTVGLRIDLPGQPMFYHRQSFYFATAEGGLGQFLNGSITPVLGLKHQGKERVHSVGGPTPPGALFHRKQIGAALAYAATLQGEVCIKPNASANGHRVYPRLRTAEDIVEALIANAAVYEDIVVEESFGGEAWRFFYVKPDIIGIKVGRAASVIGDGENSLHQLIASENSARAARSGHAASKRLPGGIIRDMMLRRQNVGLDTVIPRGRRIFLSPCSNGSQGAESLALPDLLHPTYSAWMLEIFRAMPELHAGAADVMIQQPLQPDRSAFQVIEINIAPSLLAFHYPGTGPVQDVAGAIVAMLQRLASKGA